MEKDSEQVFISYSHHDRPACDAIASLLEGLHLLIWYDKGLIPGEIYRKKIVDTIRNSDYFIVLLSSFSVRSEWVMDEVEFAKKQHKRILPIYLDDVELPDELDMILQRYHCLFWHLRSSEEEFLESLERIFGDESVREDPAKSAFGFSEFSEAENLEMRRLAELESKGSYAACYTAEASCRLGKAYLYGISCAVDRKKAAFYFRIAEYRGNPDGSAYLLQMKLDEMEQAIWDEPDEEFCEPIIRELRSLADRGSEAAMLLYANALWYGKYGCAEDMVRSAELYERCARNGNARAQYIMASNYYMGEGVPQDYDLAVMYANLCMEQKYIKSWRRWGEFYRDGRIFPQDCARAREFYARGAEAGDYHCYNRIGDMYYYGQGCEVDRDRAFAYYLKGEKAPENGQKYGLWCAKQALGRCYELGHGTERNLETAAEKYLEGYRLGCRECKSDYLRCSRQIRQQRVSSDE